MSSLLAFLCPCIGARARGARGGDGSSERDALLPHADASRPSGSAAAYDGARGGGGKNGDAAGGAGSAAEESVKRVRRPDLPSERLGRARSRTERHLRHVDAPLDTSPPQAGSATRSTSSSPALGRRTRRLPVSAAGKVRALHLGLDASSPGTSPSAAAELDGRARASNEERPTARRARSSGRDEAGVRASQSEHSLRTLYSPNAAAKVDPRERLRQAVQAAGGLCERFDATPLPEHLDSGGESGTESESLPRGSTSLPLGSAPRG